VLRQSGNDGLSLKTVGSAIADLISGDVNLVRNQVGIFLAETFESTMFDLSKSFSGIGNLKLEISDPRSFREKIPV
jgi:hypothetical protein